MNVPGNPESASLSGEDASLLPGSPRPSFEEARASRPLSAPSSYSAPRALYLSHFLSTWNTRVFEFGAVIYLAAIFPGTLLPMSIYASVRGLSAIACASAIGAFIDRENRLNAVRLSIVSQRFAVAASCAIFYLLAKSSSADGTIRILSMIALAFLACIEKVASIANFVSVEKDWVVVIARDDSSSLARLNSQMRRIDLLCKLLGPLFIALLDGYSTEAAIGFNFIMNISSVLVEYFAIARVYSSDDGLKAPKATILGLPPSNEQGADTFATHSHGDSSSLRRLWSDLRLYLTHPARAPSLAGAILYLTVLSFAGQMVTYLLSSGYSSMQVGGARTMSVVFEVAATFLAPYLLSQIGPVRAALWSGNWQFFSLLAGSLVFNSYPDRPFIGASGLVVGTILSRLGLRTFDLCTQIIVQEEVEPDIRGIFSTVEAAWQNAFELLSFASTIVFSRPDQFHYPVWLSVGAVATATLLFSNFVWVRRGHLLHPEKMAGLCGCDARLTSMG